MLISYTTFLEFIGNLYMKRLILTSLGIISLCLIFLSFRQDSKTVNKKEITTDTLKTHNNPPILIDKISINQKNNSLLPVIPNQKHSIIVNSKEKEIFTRTYLNYRNEQHQLEQKKMNHYLAHQKDLQHIKEGGVKSKLKREKEKHEVQFQHQYRSNMMSQKGNHQKNFMRQVKIRQKRQEQMQSLKERQVLQTKYRGEL